MKTKKSKPFFNLLKKIIKCSLGKYTIEGITEETSMPSIFVGNHAHSYGPFFAEISFPYKRQTWCASEIMNCKTAPKYMQEDFWGTKPKATKWFYKLISYITAPLCVYVFKNADTIPVYKDNRGIMTFKQTLKALDEGYNIIIFPENHNENNNIVNEFQQKFIDVAKLYFKQKKIELNFVPFYIAPKLKTVRFGTPIKYNSQNEIKKERSRICSHLSNEITKIAKNLPEHTVIPYSNIPKRKYPKNK